MKTSPTSGTYNFTIGREIVLTGAQAFDVTM